MSGPSTKPAERKTPPEYLALDRSALLAMLQTFLEQTRHCLDVLQLDTHPINPFQRPKALEALLKGAETQQSFTILTSIVEEFKREQPIPKAWKTDLTTNADIAGLSDRLDRQIAALNGSWSFVVNKVDGGVERIEQLLYAILRRPASDTSSSSSAPRSSLSAETLEHQDGMDVEGQQQESISTVPSSLSNCLYVHFVPSYPVPSPQRPSQSKILFGLNTRLRAFPEFDGACVLQAYWGDDSHILLLADSTATCDMLLQYQEKWLPSLFASQDFHVSLRRAGQTRFFLILEDVVRRWSTASKHYKLYGPATTRGLDQVVAELLRQYPHCAQHVIGRPGWGRYKSRFGKQDSLTLCGVVLEVDSEEFLEEFSTDNSDVVLFKHPSPISTHILRDAMY